MKKLIAILTALLICVSLAVPAAAVEADFVPSITVKPAPKVVIFKDPEGIPAIGAIVDANGQTTGYLREDCLIITSVADAKDSTEIPSAAKTLLLEVYDKLNTGDMTIPYEKHGNGLDTLNMVIRDLYDATWRCEEHPDIVAPEGVTFEITFDLGVSPNQTVYTMAYKGGEWNPIVSTTNNGDGTVTCVFEHLCPVEFSVEGDSSSSQTGDLGNEPLWALTALGALAAIVILTVLYRKDAMKHAA